MMRFQIRPEPELVYILSLIATVTKEPDMLQKMFCEHTMQQQTATAADALPRTPLGEASPDPLDDFKGVASCR